MWRDKIRNPTDTIGTIMRTLTLLTLLGAATLSAAALAAPSVTPDAGNTAMAAVQLVPGTPYKLRPVEFDGVQGTYKLDNGQTLKVSAEHRKLYVEIGRNKAELVAVAENTFVSRDEDMKVVFDQIPFANEVLVTSLARK